MASPRPLPLAGVRILDLTRLLPGAYATQMLADLGASVLKIEEPGLGDYARGMPPLKDGVGQFFLAVNRNKRSAALNLKQPAAREALMRMVEQADVVIEGYRPGVMARLVLDYDTLHARNRRLVVCSLSGYGQDGPYSQRPGHDLNYIGYAGLLQHLTAPGQPPTLPGAQFADIAGGALMAVIGIVAALIGRGVDGDGRYVDVSMLDGSLALLPILAAMVLGGDAEPAPGEAWLAGALPGYSVYETADGRYVTLGALEPKFFEEFCRRVERPDLIARQMPTDAADRQRTKDEIAAIFRTRTREAWLADLGDADVCLGPVNTLEEALADPQVRARGLVADAAGGAAVRTAPRMSDLPFPVGGGVPRLGADTAAALREAGYSEDEIGALAASGAVALG